MFGFLDEAFHLEALAVDDSRAGFVVFLFGDPHLLESGKGSEDGTSDPYGVFPFWRSDDFDFDGRRSEGGDFLLHSVGNTGVHGGASGKDSVGVQVLPDVDIAFHDRVVDGFVDTARFHTQEGRLEKGFGATEPFVTNGDDLSIGQFVGFFQGSGSGGGGHFLFKVQSDVAQFFLDVTDNFPFSGGGERVASFGEDFHQVVGQVSASQVQTEDGMRESITFIDGDGVGNTISRVEDDTGGTTGGVQGEYGLDGDIHGGGVEGLKHDLSHLFPVGFRVEGSFGQEDGVLFGGNTKFIVEGVMPDFLHIVPVGDDTVFNGVFQSEDTSFALGFISDVGVFLTHTDHHTLMPWATDDGWEDGPWSVVTGEAGFAHS